MNMPTHTHTHKGYPLGCKSAKWKTAPRCWCQEEETDYWVCEGSEVMLHVFHVDPNVSAHMQSHMWRVEDCLHASPVVSQTHTMRGRNVTLQPSQKNGFKPAYRKYTVYFSWAWKVATFGLLGLDFLILNTQQRQCANSWRKAAASNMHFIHKMLCIT